MTSSSCSTSTRTNANNSLPGRSLSYKRGRPSAVRFPPSFAPLRHARCCSRYRVPRLSVWVCWVSSWVIPRASSRQATYSPQTSMPVLSSVLDAPPVVVAFEHSFAFLEFTSSRRNLYQQHFKRTAILESGGLRCLRKRSQFKEIAIR
jgi:hypothetical protein